MAKKKNEYELMQESKKLYQQACVYHAHEQKDSTWHALIEWADIEYQLLNYKRVERSKTTPRQQEVQRLWMQRGLLERTKANLSIVEKLIREEKFPLEADKLREAYLIVNARIAINMNAASSVKERIPS